MSQPPDTGTGVGSPWPALLASTAAAWHGSTPDAAHAENLSEAYPRWQRLASASAANLPMDSVPVDFDRLLCGAPTAAAIPLRRGPAPATPPGTDPLSLPLTDAAALLRSGGIASRELTLLALQRLKALHAATNCCVSIDDDAALAEADRLDTALRRGEPAGPLHGLPLAHKDMLYRQGWEVGCGLRPRAVRSHAFEGTAPVLLQLARAGAVHCARLHMTELAFEPSGANDELGPCRNPWSPDHATGGSSSGSAAVVAGRAVFGALGSDTGGSVRIPAALCGITGLKTTRGLVDLRGAMPLSHSNDTLGPLVRSAADGARLMQVLANGAGDPAVVSPAPALEPSRQAALIARFAEVASGQVAELRGLRIGVPGGMFAQEIDPVIADRMAQSLRTLQGLGAVLVAVPAMDWSAINLAAAILTRAEASARLARLRTVGGVSAALLARFEEGLAIPASVYLQLLAQRAGYLQDFLQRVMAGVDVLHAPVCRIRTPRIATLAAGGPEAARLRAELTVMNRPFNFLGVPSLALPCGFAADADDGREMPVAFQLVGRPFADADLLAIGAAWQAATDWHARAAPLAGR